MFSRIDVKTPVEVFTYNSRVFTLAPIRMANEFPAAIAPLRKEYVETMGKEPPPVPTYQRTNQLSTSWVTMLTIDAKQALLTSYNGTPYKRYVQGRQARPFHIARGWRQELVVVPVVQRQAQVIARGLWQRVSTPATAGRR